MKVVDESHWLAQVAELSATDDGKVFLAFLEEWADRAEGLLPMFPCISALRQTFEPTEEKLGQIPGSWLGQLLLVIGVHWTHGADALGDMTVFEQRIVLDAKAQMVQALQEQAAQVPTSLPDYLQVVPTE